MMKNTLSAGVHPGLYSAYSHDDGLLVASGPRDGEQVNYIAFNQDNSCVAIGTSSGYKVYNCTVDRCYRQVKNEPVGLIEMLYTTSLVAMVGLGEELGSSPRKLKVVNSKRNSTICDLVFPSTILGVKLSRQRMVVLLESQIYIYDIATMRLLHTIETSPNPSGLCAFNNGDLVPHAHTFLAYPSPPKTITHDSLLVNGINTNGGNNSVQNNIQSVSNSPNRVGDVIIFNTATLQPLLVIEAHKSTLAAMALSDDGVLLATASDKGTIVRVFNVIVGVKLFQFRRGTYPTRIFLLKFSADNKFVLATSSSGTVHIFRLGEDEALENKHRRKKTKSSLSDPIQEEEEEETAANEDDVIRDDGDDSDAEEGLEEELGEEEAPKRKLSQGSTGLFASVNSGLSNEEIPTSQNGKTDPIVDQTRLLVARIIRRSSQTLGRKAAQKMGDFLPLRFLSILEPTRHFASIKITSVGRDVKSIAAMGSGLQEDVVPEHYLKEGQEAREVKLLHVNVVTSEGICYTYGLDPERGGDCILLRQYSLLALD